MTHGMTDTKQENASLDERVDCLLHSLEGKMEFAPDGSMTVVIADDESCDLYDLLNSEDDPFSQWDPDKESAEAVAARLGMAPSTFLYWARLRKTVSWQQWCAQLHELEAKSYNVSPEALTVAKGAEDVCYGRKQLEDYTPFQQAAIEKLLFRCRQKGDVLSSKPEREESDG